MVCLLGNFERSVIFWEPSPQSCFRRPYFCVCVCRHLFTLRDTSFKFYFLFTA